MKVSLDDEGSCQRIIERLNALGVDFNKAAKSTILALCHKIQEEAVMRAPIDEGFLEKSITVDVENAAMAADIVGHVFIPANSPAAPYALWIHEGTYKLGPGSLQKQGASPVMVGRKYMERAWLENLEALRALSRAKLLEGLKT